ncbi:hypothetical protein CDAR_546281 [Caerostris darwini]|uniref:Uncharacterized protein n=1 Tax=Caerostris darwini TaxID=1538125 RepID=A0AAV4RQ00_9ARAC|nr:hypothetical protein CDAR_546281 [Caerostris darwini]
MSDLETTCTTLKWSRLMQVNTSKSKAKTLLITFFDSKAIKNFVVKFPLRMGHIRKCLDQFLKRMWYVRLDLGSLNGCLSHQKITLILILNNALISLAQQVHP